MWSRVTYNIHIYNKTITTIIKTSIRKWSENLMILPFPLLTLWQPLSKRSSTISIFLILVAFYEEAVSPSWHINTKHMYVNILHYVNNYFNHNDEFHIGITRQWKPSLYLGVGLSVRVLHCRMSRTMVALLFSTSPVQGSLTVSIIKNYITQGHSDIYFLNHMGI